MEWYNWCIANNIDILIHETIRTEEQQRENVKKGVSKTMHSYHLVGQALDFVPVVNGKADWNGYDRQEIQKAIAKAKELGFTWGADWDNDGKTSDESFIDKPHLQFEYKGYGTDKVLESKPAAAVASNSTKPAPAAGQNSSAIVPYPGTPFKLGSKGKDVERIQRALQLQPTGTFDQKTVDAVKAYQKRKGLAVDGIVGQQTWNTLF
nr:peptidoglycan-binding protein [Anoxybacillus sp. B7M1]